LGEKSNSTLTISLKRLLYLIVTVAVAAGGGILALLLDLEGKVGGLNSRVDILETIVLSKATTETTTVTTTLFYYGYGYFYPSYPSQISGLPIEFLIGLLLVLLVVVPIIIVRDVRAASQAE
jgi:hypothetical protein